MEGIHAPLASGWTCASRGKIQKEVEQLKPNSFLAVTACSTATPQCAMFRILPKTQVGETVLFSIYELFVY